MLQNILNKIIRQTEKTAFSYEALDTEKIRRTDHASIARAFARLFSGDDGKTVLAYLQMTVFQRALGSDATDEQIRYTEGQRALLGNIMQLAEKGKQGQ